MLGRVRFGRAAVAANVKLGWGAAVLLGVLNLIVLASDVLKPFERRVVGPGVKNRHAGTSLGFFGHLLGAVFIFHLEGRKFTELVEAVIQVLLNQVLGAAH